jgi:hypothetical protein
MAFIRVHQKNVKNVEEAIKVCPFNAIEFKDDQIEITSACKIYKNLDKAKEKKFAEPKGPIKPASEDDIQFVQAMNVLKGLPVETTPSEEVKEAEVIPK